MIGERLGDYRIDKLISYGVISRVYLATSTLFDLRTAIRVFSRQFSNQSIRRYFREVRDVAMLGHRGIVAVLDIGIDERDLAYQVMEYLDGESLRMRLKRQATIPIPKAIQLFDHLASALEAAHQQDIVHLGLTPGSVMLVEDPYLQFGERPKIVDFGIANLANEAANTSPVATTNVVMGTPSYMAPEQRRGAGAVDHRADLYSLGCIMFHVLCGRPPFVGEGIQQFVQPPSPRSIDPSLPARLDALVLKLLAKDPAARPATATEIRAELSTSRSCPTRVRLGSATATEIRAELSTSPWATRRQLVRPATATEIRAELSEMNAEYLGPRVCAPEPEASALLSGSETTVLSSRRWRLLAVLLTLVSGTLTLWFSRTADRSARRLCTAPWEAWPSGASTEGILCRKSLQALASSAHELKRLCEILGGELRPTKDSAECLVAANLAEFQEQPATVYCDSDEGSETLATVELRVEELEFQVEELLAFQEAEAKWGGVAMFYWQWQIAGYESRHGKSRRLGGYLNELLNEQQPAASSQIIRQIKDTYALFWHRVFKKHADKNVLEHFGDGAYLPKVRWAACVRHP
ncbi:MAG: serine/threonine protein kinase [Proteobacteria bacterium]|nr:serine/threonine protein kinase [Pseudomonadota bacterium]